MFKKRLMHLTIASAVTGGLVVNAVAQDAPKDTASNTIVEEVIVTGVRQAELNAREMERQKKIFSSIIAQDDAGNFADQNVAESLKRLPGVTLQMQEGEGTHVNIRGLGSEFVNVSVNGNEMASASEDTRGKDTGSASLNSFPADLMGSIEVFKSLTPDMDLNSIGGTVNINSTSAFTYDKNTLKATLQTGYQDYAGKLSPKISLRGTHKYSGDTLGVAYAVSHEKNTTQVYDDRHHETSLPDTYQQRLPDQSSPGDNVATVIGPYQFQMREENGERTRMAGSVDLEYRPTDNHSFKISASHTQYEDNEITRREYLRFDGAGSDEVAYVNPSLNEFGVIDAELQHQIFFQTSDSTTSNFAFSGESIVGGDLTLDYKLSMSKSKWDKPDGQRLQLRTRDVAMVGRAGKDFIKGEVVSEAEMRALGGYEFVFADGEDRYTVDGIDTQEYSSYIDYDEVNNSNMHLDNVFLEQSVRDDSVNSFSFNLQKDYDSDAVNYLKAGFRFKSRDRDRNKDRQSFDPGKNEADGCDALYNDVDTKALCENYAEAYREDFNSAFADHPDYQYSFITVEDAKSLLNIVAPLAPYSGDTSAGNIDSSKDDYTISEDTSAVYLMAEFNVIENGSLIIGARYESVELDSVGFFSIENDDFAFEGDEAAGLDVVLNMPASTKTYSNFLPSMHFRYEASEEWLFRAAVWTSYVRPTFNEVRTFAKIDGDIELCEPGTEVDGIPGTGQCDDDDTSEETARPTSDYVLAQSNKLEIGNPNLNPMEATNIDLSASWNPSDDLYLQAAFFYKDIKNFIVDIKGAEIALNNLPVQLPIAQVNEFVIPSDLLLTDVHYSENGDTAKVFGIELTYSQHFETGLFTQANLTLLDSEGRLDDSFRVGSIKLPDQADETANLTLGWENEKFSTRLTGNYRSEILYSIGSCPADGGCNDWADVYADSDFGVDFKATYKINNRVKVFFDAINLTDDDSLRYFSGNESSNGNMLYSRERFGASYQLGINIDIY